MTDLRARVRAGARLVCDGGMGTELIARGLGEGACPERMNLDAPDVLESIAAAYAAAGADLVHTNTFGANPLKLAAYDLAERCDEINQAAVRAARRGAGARALVSASVGPTGRLLEPYGDTAPEAVADAFARQVAALVAAGVDAITVETMTDLTEATLAVEAARRAAPTLPVFATLTFDPTPKGFRTVMGVSVEAACAALAAAGADALGANCGHGAETLVPLAIAFKAATSLPVLVQPNAGLPEWRAGQVVYPETPERLAEHASALLRAGVTLLGGCCGTTPAHIQALRQLIDQGAAPAREQ